MSTPKRPRFHVDVPGHLIQSVRLVHALMESSSFRVHVPFREASKYRYLKRFFDISYTPTRFGSKRVIDVGIDHSVPESRIGGLARPLIFPHAAVQRCRELWSADREAKFYFAGKLTAERAGVIGALRDGPAADNFVILASERGRVWPLKAWDDEYYQTMGRFTYALCPEGDFGWSYRFFEAMLCGAIPVIQKRDTYNAGFVTATMDELPDPAIYRIEDAELNFALVSALLTIPREVIDAELIRLLS